jgi:hypothetical protein
MLPNDESNKAINGGSERKLLADRQQLIAQGWYKDSFDDIKLDPIVLAADSEGHGEDYYALVVNRKGIKSAYSNIPLKIMADYAKSADVKLKISPKLEIRADTILNKEPDLLQLETKILGYIASTKNSKAEDWLNDQSPFLKAIRYQHLNFSAEMGIGYFPRIRKGKRTRYIYNA